MTQWRAELALALVCLLWGSTFVLVKNAPADISTVLFLGLRFGIAAVLLLILYVARGGRWRGGGSLFGGLLTGGFLYAGYLLQTLGLHHTTPAMSGFITGLYIPMVPVLAAAVSRRNPAPSEWTGFALATAGMALLSLQGAGWSIGPGELLTVGCAVAFAVQILLLGYYSRRTNTDLLSLQQIAVCAIVGLCTFWWVEPVVLRWTPGVIQALVITSVFATALAFWIQTWAQARTSPTRAALIFSLEPVFAWLTSWAVGGELLTGRSLAGATCILSGILLVELKPIGRRKHPES